MIDPVLWALLEEKLRSWNNILKQMEIPDGVSIKDWLRSSAASSFSDSSSVSNNVDTEQINFFGPMKKSRAGLAARVEAISLEDPVSSFVVLEEYVPEAEDLHHSSSSGLEVFNELLEVKTKAFSNCIKNNKHHLTGSLHSKEEANLICASTSVASHSVSNTKSKNDDGNSISSSGSVSDLSTLSSSNNKREDRNIQSNVIPSLGNSRTEEVQKLNWRINVRWPSWARQLQGLPSGGCDPRHFCFICPSNLGVSEMQRLCPSSAAKNLLLHVLSEQHKQHVERRRPELLKIADQHHLFIGRYVKEVAESTVGTSLELGSFQLPRLNDVDYVVAYRGRSLTNGCVLRLWNKSDKDLLVRFEAAVSSSKGYGQWVLKKNIANSNNYTTLFDPRDKFQVVKHSDSVLMPNKTDNFVIDVLDTMKGPKNFSIGLLFLVSSVESIDSIQTAQIKCVFIDFIPKDFLFGN